MATLFNLTNEYKQLLELASSADPEDEQLFDDTLEGLTGEIELKADDYAAVRTMLKSQSEMVAKEINRLKAVEDTLNAHIKRMETTLQNAMLDIGTKEIKTDLHKFKIVNNGGKLPLIMDGDYPEEYSKKETVITPDKDKIREALENGEILTFAHLAERGTHLKID